MFFLEELTSQRNEADASGAPVNNLTCGGLFAGIGGFCIGFEAAGFQTAWCLDNSESAATTYGYNFPGINYICSDVREVTSKILDPVDILHAGFPCQSFSSAGNRKGFDDERGRLFNEIPKLIDDWGNSRPKVLVLENSPFIRMGDGGAWLKEIQSKIRRCGYWFSDKNCFELDTHEHGGLPQRRKRLFMIAVRSDIFDFNGVNLVDFSPTVHRGLSEIIEDGPVENAYYLPIENKYNSMISKKVQEDPNQIYQLRKYEVRLPAPGMCPTLTANMGLGGHNVPFVYRSRRLRKLTEYECLALQGFPESFRFPPELTLSRRYTLIGNSVSPKISEIIAQRVLDFLNGKRTHDVYERH